MVEQNLQCYSFYSFHVCSSVRPPTHPSIYPSCQTKGAKINTILWSEEMKASWRSIPFGKELVNRKRKEEAISERDGGRVTVFHRICSEDPTVKKNTHQGIVHKMDLWLDCCCFWWCYSGEWTGTFVGVGSRIFDNDAHFFVFPRKKPTLSHRETWGNSDTYKIIHL